jgi:hypothetical protein
VWYFAEHRRVFLHLHNVLNFDFSLQGKRLRKVCDSLEWRSQGRVLRSAGYNLQLAGETPQVHEPQDERISLDEGEFENMGQIGRFCNKARSSFSVDRGVACAMRKCGSANSVRSSQLTAKEHDPTSMRYMYGFMDHSATNCININLNYSLWFKEMFCILFRRSQSQLPSRG